MTGDDLSAAIDADTTARDALFERSCVDALAYERELRQELESRIRLNHPGGETTTSDPNGW